MNILKARFFVYKYGELFEEHMLMPKDSDEPLSFSKFKWISDGPETSHYFDFWFDDNIDIEYYTTGLFSGGNWYLTEHTENYIKFEGGGAGGLGYIEIDKIAPKWYLVEKYLLT